MKPAELNEWLSKVLENCQSIRNDLEDRLALKEEITEHLRQFFEFEEIEFTHDMDCIKLKYKYGHDPVIRDKSLSKLGMDFIITTTYSDKLGQGIVIELYPFGLGEN